MPFFVLTALGELLHADLLLRFDLAKGRRFELAVLVEGREPLPYANRLPLCKPCSQQTKRKAAGAVKTAMTWRSA